MNIWATLIGGAAGFALGGPIGALLGAAAGQMVDRYRAPEIDEDPERAKKSVAFTIGVIALSAKMAKADGTVTRDEVVAFREMFHVPPDEVANVDRFFDLAKRDTAGFEAYARQVAGLFRRSPAVLEELLGGLFHIALADGRVPPEELDYLNRVATIFGFDAATFDRIRRLHLGNTLACDDPYATLGLTRDASDAEIKAAHRRLLFENHPDRLVADGMPQEAVDLATETAAALNAAWDKIRAERRLTSKVEA